MRTARNLRFLIIAALLAIGCDSDPPETTGEDTATTQDTAETTTDATTTAADATAEDTTTAQDATAEDATTEEEVAEDVAGDEEADATASVAPDFQLQDVNTNSATGGELVSPRDYLGQISAYYFTHAT